MENETGTQERTGSDGSKEGGVKYNVAKCLGEWFVCAEDGRAVAKCPTESDCRMIVDALNTPVEHRPACVPTEGSK